MRSLLQELEEQQGWLEAAGFYSPGSGSSNMGHPSSFCRNKTWRRVILEEATLCAGLEVVWREHPKCAGGPDGLSWCFALYAKAFPPNFELPPREGYETQGRAPHFWLSCWNIEDLNAGRFNRESRILSGGLDHLERKWVHYTGSFDEAFTQYLQVAMDGYAETQTWPWAS